MNGKVGVIFLRGDTLSIDSAQVNDAVDYGDLKTHENGHPDFWEELQVSGAVPRDEEYDEVPRGRVTYHTRKRLYYLFLDRCISERSEMVSRIFSAIQLPPPPATVVLGDSHYVCPGCMPKSRHKDDEDW
jgi:hypothetical protein